MAPYAIYNGNLLPEDEIHISPNNRSFKFGDGCFETMKVINNIVLLSELHFQRLFSSLQTLRFTVPVFFTAAYLLDQIAILLTQNRHQNFARLRLVVYRADGNTPDTNNVQLHFIIQSWAGDASSLNFNKKGLSVGFFPDAKKNADLFSSIKSNNYLCYIMAGMWAKDNCLDDSILMNGFNRIADATIANIFLVKDGVIKTPSLNEGCVSGVMRSYLINCFKKENIPFYEAEITVQEVLQASEVFFTNANYGIRWVEGVAKSSYRNSISSYLHQKFIVPLFSATTI